MKGLKIVGAIVALLVLLLVTLPLLLVSKLEPIVLSEANKQLDATVAFEKLDLSLLAHFPQASISLQNLSVVGHEPFEGDTLVSAKEITMVVNLLSIFGNSGFDVSKVLLQTPKLNALVKSDGKVNWDILKRDSLTSPSDTTNHTPQATEATSQEKPAQEASAPSTFRLLLKDVQLKEGQLSYKDEVSQTAATITGLNWSLRGDMSAQQTLLDTDITLAAVTLVQEKLTLLNGVKMGWKASIDANINDKQFTLKENTLQINALKATLTGKVAQQDSTLLVDLVLNSEKMEFKELLSLLPAFYTKDFEGLTATGQLALDAWVKGNYSSNQIPAFETKVTVQKGSFKYAELPKAVEQIEVALAISNPGGELNNTVIDLSTLSLTMAGQKVNGSMQVTTPLSDPYLATTLHGVVNLGAIKEVYPLPDSLALNGVITADLALASHLSAIEKQAYEKIAAQGNFSVEGMKLTMKGVPTIAIEKAHAEITPAAMVLSNAQLQVGKSDVALQGKVSNYLAYALKGELLTGQLNVVSKQLDLNEWMGSDYTAENQAVENSQTSTTKASESAEPAANTPPTTAGGTPSFTIPTNLDLKLQATVGQIAFQQLRFSNFTGQIGLAKGSVEMSKLSMNGLGGKLAASGLFSTAPNPKQPQLSINTSIQEASFEETFKQLEIVQQIAPLFAKTGGNYSLSLTMSAALDSTLSPILTSVNGKGEIRSANIALQNLELFTQLADALNDERLKKVEAKDVKVAFTIAEGKITTAPFDLKMGGVNLNLAGTTNLEQQIDYKATVSLPNTGQSFLQKIPVLIGGTFTAPTVTLGVKEMVGDAVKNVLLEEVNKLVGGTLKDSLSTGMDREALLKEAKAQGDKLIETAKKEGQALVDKTNNPLLKVAAQKSADLLVEVAQKKAQQLLEEAEAKSAK